MYRFEVICVQKAHMRKSHTKVKISKQDFPENVDVRRSKNLGTQKDSGGPYL